VLCGQEEPMVDIINRIDAVLIEVVGVQLQFTVKLQREKEGGEKEKEE
jgi:hypothetical protein